MAMSMAESQGVFAKCQFCSHRCPFAAKNKPGYLEKCKPMLFGHLIGKQEQRVSTECLKADPTLHPLSLWLSLQLRQNPPNPILSSVLQKDSLTSFHVSYSNNVLFSEGRQSWRVTNSIGYRVGGSEKVTSMRRTLCNNSRVSKLRGISTWKQPRRLWGCLCSKHDEVFEVSFFFSGVKDTLY